ncbi:hypothetical protein HDU77_004552 [Chytriomyces hyalinus]|nr:hypothetical protein HDU77_004552 [Chytriomyces hyalinus]
MTSHKIDRYLNKKHQKQGTSGLSYGYCRICHVEVAWSSNKVASHKRANCPNQPDDHKAVFLGTATVSEVTVDRINNDGDSSVSEDEINSHKKRARSKVSSSTGQNASNTISKWQDSVNQAEKEEFDALLAKFVFRKGITLLDQKDAIDYIEISDEDFADDI